MKTAVSALAVIFTLVCAGGLAARTWKEAGSERTLEGDLVKIEGDAAVIRRPDGSTVSVPLARLSDEDQAFAKSQAAAPAPAAAPATASAPAASGEQVILSGVHLCCGGCEKGVEDALADIEGVGFDMSRTAKTITFTGAKIQDALDALAKNGYYGESSSETIKIADADAPDKKTDSVSVTGVHLCCGSCVKAVDKALATVEGFGSHNAAKDAPAFTVYGENITAAAVLAALRAEGLSGIVR